MACKDNTRAQVARIGKCKKVVIANVVWRTVLVPCGYLGFCHYECSEVIQKQLLLAMRLLLSLCSISSDKNRAISVELVSRLPPPRHKCGSWQAHI